MRRMLYTGLTISVITLAPLIAGAARSGKGATTAVPSQTPLAQQESSQARTQVLLIKEIRHELVMLPYFEVLPLSPNDDRIRRAVYRAIFNFNSPLFRYATVAVPSIHIIVKNGNVTLKGVVASQADSNLANIKANGVSGVFSVKNDLTVENR